MIPRGFIQEWRAVAPWPEFRQVEQDLVISRALCDLFSSGSHKGRIAFRGGTAINKFLFPRPLRYSEDIDLVQLRPEAVGKTLDGIREALGWLGPCNVAQAVHSTHLVFKFVPEGESKPMKLKVEINTREHENLLGNKEYALEMVNSWHSARVSVESFKPEELFGTKLRALLQRCKNRDLFDLYHGFRCLEMNSVSVVEAFLHYLKMEGQAISRNEAERRMLEKLRGSLVEDVAPLLPTGIEFDESRAVKAFELVWWELIAKIPGEPWKLTEEALVKFRSGRYPNLLLDGVLEDFQK
jgi:predicted nucleotidyltransferase component of viral defense system